VIDSDDAEGDELAIASSAEQPTSKRNKKVSRSKLSIASLQLMSAQMILLLRNNVIDARKARRAYEYKGKKMLPELKYFPWECPVIGCSEAFLVSHQS